MCAPSSRLIAANFLQHLGHLHLAHLAPKYHIVSYCRYVEDILLICDSNNTCIQNLVKDFNALRPKLQFTAEIEENQTLNYLYVTIHRTHKSFKMATGSPLSPTPSYHIPQTTPHITNTLLSDSCSTD